VRGARILNTLRKFYYRNHETAKLVRYVRSFEEVREETEIDALNYGEKRENPLPFACGAHRKSQLIYPQDISFPVSE
jgi:hypothetical protein